MREEKPKSPSPINGKRMKKNNWLWPVVYSSIAVLFVGLIWGYTAFVSSDAPGVKDSASKGSNTESSDLVVETNAKQETLKYPFSEALLDDVAILHEFYDMEADAEIRENAMLVFNQTYTTNTGVCISVGDEPFEVVASMSGIVEEVVTDVFSGDEIVITHANGTQTVYGSVTEVLVKKGDEVTQGQALATASSNEWNPTAGTHLHFEVIEDGEYVNPRLSLAF